MELVRIGEVSVALAARKATQILKKGGIVLYPTDTLYCLAVDATNPRALARLCAVKCRDPKRPFAVVVPDIKTIEQFAHVSDTARRLALQFMPGPLTLVLPVYKGALETVGLAGAVGFSIPDDPFSLELARVFGAPFTATSANRSGRENSETVQGVLSQLGPDGTEIALVIDDGPRNPSRTPTVARVLNDEVHILREGVIPRGDICG